ncbi:PadR family transcriptional regulator [Sinanaerobacter chloroacetimidivorans]|jgi:PadR family transcriptional regulator PadR|uniref:PadR family transcriptional regulator n=1 Tax=Sinanaerobacter chloroacetimidivorans TaxID=2818044 RepID=A0A8J7VYH7_9FIRM|nr:PadR family transcriptional regulator [Sinanaerobacter chloroacetimidivorans]MBR0597079.1 PadR family transcriptional regulator [Sinanaerobacter chloroacetimidivorans]
MDTQLKKGVLEMCILIQLGKKDMYGYEIMKIIQDVFPEVYDGSIYTILRRIHGEGYTETYMKDVPSGGPARKYYRITDSGKKYYSRMMTEWSRMTESVKKLIDN